MAFEILRNAALAYCLWLFGGAGLLLLLWWLRKPDDPADGQK